MRRTVFLCTGIIFLLLVSSCSYPLREQVPPGQLADSCIDSDSGDPFLAGTTTVLLDGQETQVEDVCDLSEVQSLEWGSNVYKAVVHESNCKGTESAIEITECTFGCLDGACIRAETCEDTEIYVGPREAGVVSVGEVELSDVCFDAKTVDDYVCWRGELRIFRSSCGWYQSCIKGACVTQDELPHCADSDGKDAETQGIVRMGDSEEMDSCQSITMLREFYCEDEFSVAYEDVDCSESGKYCMDGVCYSTSGKCWDSDGGSNPDKRGQVIFMRPSEISTAEDNCFNVNVLNECECGDYAAAFHRVSCESYNNGVCANGACVSTTCTDYEKGHAADLPGTLSFEGVEYDDTCSGDVVLDYYCEKGELVTAEHDCSAEGKVCRDGACVIAGDGSQEDEAPQDFPVFPLSECAVLSEPGTYLLGNDVDIGFADGPACMVITGTDITLDCQGHTITGRETAVRPGGPIAFFYNYGIYVNSSPPEPSYLRIKDCIVNSTTFGIYAEQMTYSSISGCLVRNTLVGIELTPYTAENSISNLEISRNLRYGINAYGSRGLKIMGTTFEGNVEDIRCTEPVFGEGNSCSGSRTVCTSHCGKSFL